MDRISGLSDELLLKILLLLPTKVAVSTSVLSKRWEYLWMWLPKLKYIFWCCPEPEFKRLLRFLERNMPLHRAPVIESFRLELSDSRLKPENVNMWVLAAVSHCLRELDILYESHPSKPITLPSNLFTCKSLVILKLVGCFLLDVPRMVSLPSLKTLKLEYVTCFNDQTLQRLLSNCPVLEDLDVDLSDRETIRKLSLVVPSLQILSITMLYDHGIDDGLVIDTPALKYFKLVDHNGNDHCCLIQHMPYLIEAHIDVQLLDINSLTGSIASVKRLAICSEDKFVCDEGFVFNQLKHLEDHESVEIDDWDQPSTVPECMMSSLQTLKFLTYAGEPQERDMVVYILKHARHLKTATIKSCRSEVPEFEMLKVLALSSRASTACKLVFE